MKIAVTDCSKYDAYARWISADPGIEAVRISYRDDSLKLIEACDGVVLTGGEDVHPRFYNRPDLLSHCYRDDVDEKRDELEFRVIEKAQQRDLPLLGICRGLQVANVFFGGTLIADIPFFTKKQHSKVEGSDRYHGVRTTTGTALRNIVGQDSGEVNSAHHQSADTIAPGLSVNAVSDDGIVEGLEWQHPDGKPFLMLVQWHPERMKDQQNPFAMNIRSAFIDAVMKKQE